MASDGTSQAMQELMETTFSVWELMTVGAVETPEWYAVVFGMLDSIGQAYGADQQATKAAMTKTLGEARVGLCLLAGQRPALFHWVMEGGQAVHRRVTSESSSAADIYAALARRYLADSRASAPMRATDRAQAKYPRWHWWRR